MSPVAVITGASAGVGRAAVRAFVECGYDLGLVARGSDGLDAAAKEVESERGVAIALPTDVADAGQVEAAAAAVERDLGPIDVWVNDAMATVFAPAWEVTPEEFRRVTEVTYLGFVHGTVAALARMRPRDRGVIVQVGSALAYRAIPLQSAYCGAKHAMKGFTESLRTELMHDRSGVRVTMVHLPALNTPQFEWSRAKMPRHPRPVPPIYQPEVAARAIVHAAEHPRREYWVGGPTVGAILGERLLPGLLDRYLARTGFDAQQLDEPLDPGRRDNLFAPVPGDHGAHGRFGPDAKERSPQWWLARRRTALAAGAVVVAVAAIGARRSR